MRKKNRILSLLIMGMFSILLVPFGVSAQKGEKFLYSPNPIPGRYIVVLEDAAAGPLGPSSNAPSVAAALTAQYGGTIRKIFTYAINAYSVEMSARMAMLLAEDSRVGYVQEDAAIQANQTAAASWGQDRIDQRFLLLNGLYNFTSTGESVDVYVLDTGIRPTHVDFGGRASVAYDAVGDGQNGIDCNGHGTHVAGTVGSTTYGVAKRVKLLAVRVLDCFGGGTLESVTDGVNWVTQNRSGPTVVNMSLGTEFQPIPELDDVVAGSIASGITYVVAAGNRNLNACNISPARTPNALTVGATTITDQRASFSNFGTCLDLFAPGVDILSTSFTSNTATEFMSGTSMASPHAAGIAALYLQRDPTASPATVNNFVKNIATANVLGNIGAGSPNRLLYSLLHSGNGIDQANLFVRHHYLDFLKREPDQGGWDYWTNEITMCGTNQTCIANRRVGVSGAFLYSDEFLESRPGLRNPPGVTPDFNNSEFIRQCYLGYYRRQPTQTELNTLTAQLNALTAIEPGPPSYQAIVQIFITSQEYRQRFGAN